MGGEYLFIAENHQKIKVEAWRMFGQRKHVAAEGETVEVRAAGADGPAELVASLLPKNQLLVKRPDLAKVLQLNVAEKDYWIYTNSPFDNERKRRAFERYGFERGLQVLCEQGQIFDGSESDLPTERAEGNSELERVAI